MVCTKHMCRALRTTPGLAYMITSDSSLYSILQTIRNLKQLVIGSVRGRVRMNVCMVVFQLTFPFCIQLRT